MTFTIGRGNDIVRPDLFLRPVVIANDRSDPGLSRNS